ncbi:hypothetical protein QSI_0318 [Clostridioides difficile P28]|nr:hypothetical protein QSI_0318 [Clostridioides difficile P28]
MLQPEICCHRNRDLNCRGKTNAAWKKAATICNRIWNARSRCSAIGWKYRMYVLTLKTCF